MEMAQQYHKANVYKFGLASDFASGESSIVSEYMYLFSIYSDTSTNPVLIRKVPILGGRDFENFDPIVLPTTPLTEAEKYGVDLTGRWLGYPNITATLNDLVAGNVANPTITVFDEVSGCAPKGGFLIWKSALGGIMYWGMDIKKHKFSKKHIGRLDTSIYESTDKVSGGHIYKPMDYTGVATSVYLTLKALSLSSEELMAVAGINFSPAVFFLHENGKLELMRVSRVSAPISSLANGGDFSVSLRSMGMVEQMTI